MKKTIFTTVIAIAITLTTQAQQFTLSKGVVVGCSGANSLTDLSKNVTVTIEDGKGTMVLKSMNCSKTIEAMSMGVINSSTNGTGYYNTKDGKGFIIENGNKLIVFSGKDGKYEVTGVGHTDKKQAKTLDATVEQNNYASSFGNFEILLKNAKEEAEKAKMQAKMLPIPTGDYSDKYGIGGLYYFSEPLEIISSGNYRNKFVTAVQLEFSREDMQLYAHFAEGDNNKMILRIFDQDYSKSVKDDKASTIPSFEFDNMSDCKELRGKRMYLVENGLYFVTVFGTATSSLDCSKPEYYPTKDRDGNPIEKIFFIGKDKARVKEMASNYETALQTILTAYVSNCEYSNSLYGANNPMPVMGMKDATLQKKATEATKLHTDAHWSQTVEYVYIKNTEWVINRNKFTGEIISRSITGIAVMKTKGGACQWEEIVLRENYDGASYGSIYYFGNSQRIYPVDCATAMKYKK